MRINVLKGRTFRSIKKSEITGEAVVSKTPVTLLGFFNPKTGVVNQRGHELDGKSIAGKILVYPVGIGSTVAPYILKNLEINRVAPKAIIVREPDQGTVSGASISGIPLVYELDVDPVETIKDGDLLKISIRDGISLVTIVKRKRAPLETDAQSAPI
jgi:predicted aconitase with swiveling domain